MRQDNRLIDVATLKRSHRVEDVVASYGVDLRPVGRALVGRCLLHDDQGRPNLYVYPLDLSWYCYRCGVGGDVIKLVQLKERLDFKAACAWIEARPPSPAREWQARSQPRGQHRWERLTLDQQALMTHATRVYERLLWHDEAALSYVRRRGLSDRVIRDCAIGYSDGRSFAATLTSEPQLQLAEELGLIWPADPGREHRPRREVLGGRIVVPELRWGLPIWFIGRVLANRDPADCQSQRGPKYLALPGERPVLGLERAAGQREVILCEGVFDFLTALTWHFAACCVSGTRMPADRFGFLAMAEMVHAVFDGDGAGHEAAARFAVELGDRLQPARLPDGLDLNSLACQPDGERRFRDLIETNRQARTGQSVATTERNEHHASSR